MTPGVLFSRSAIVTCASCCKGLEVLVAGQLLHVPVVRAAAGQFGGANAAESDYIRLLAVMHFKQPPSYWLHRLTD